MRVTKTGNQKGPNDLQVEKAIDGLRAEVTSNEFKDHFRLDEIPSLEMIALNLKPLLMASRGATPRLVQTIGKAKFSLFVASDASPNDPYCAHPHWNQIEGDLGVLNLLRHFTYDAVAEYKCTLKSAEIRPATIRYIKDTLLRLPGELVLKSDEALAGNDDSDDEE